MTARVKELQDGESFSRAARFPLDGDTPRKAAKHVAALRNSMGQIAVRAREATDRGYRVETGQFVTHDGSALVVTVVVTCTDDEGEDDI